MKGKLMLHYSLSFILACLVIVVINVVFMRSSIYKEGALYNYSPEKMIKEFSDYVYLSEDGKINISDQGMRVLAEEEMGIQILNEGNQEVFSHNKPTSVPNQYSNVSLVNLYNQEEVTVFLEDKILEGQTYTYLLFLDADQVRRVNYTYDVSLVEKAHRFPILISINVILITLISFLYTLRLTRPINRIVSRILELSSGEYGKKDYEKGVYFEVEKCLGELANRLESNEQERKKLEEMREEWISNISHDIKTPLTTIMGNAEIMADTQYEIADEARRKYCQAIISKSKYMKTLVEDLNLSTRLKSNMLVLNKERVNIVSLIRHVVIDIINDEKYPDSPIQFDYENEEMVIEGDKQLMKRVFINLITNAFVHNHEDVKVKIEIKKIKVDKIFILIEDNGKGVSEEELLNIFKRYYRGTSTSKRIEGSGLGMAIAHDIIEVHGGEISAKSKLGKGLSIEINI